MAVGIGDTFDSEQLEKMIQPDSELSSNGMNKFEKETVT